MRERPILMSGPLVRAVLEGRKFQTRRPITPQPPTPERFRGSDFGLSRAVADGVKMYSQNDWERLPKHPTDWDLVGSVGVAKDAGFPLRYRCPHGQVGDRLWVREAWQAYHQTCVESDEWEVCEGAPSVLRENYAPHIEYRATSKSMGPWRPSIHMPRWASRLSLVITDVRVERLQAISEEDARAEGVERIGDRWRDYMPEREAPTRTCATARESFCSLWESIYGTASLAANPWVWAISFEREVTP